MAGKEVYEHFLDKIAHALNKQWELNRECQNVSKDDSHLLRLAAKLHAFYDQLKKQVDRLRTLPPPTIVRLETLKQDISLTQNFTDQHKVLDQVSEFYTACLFHCYFHSLNGLQTFSFAFIFLIRYK